MVLQYLNVAITDDRINCVRFMWCPINILLNKVQCFIGISGIDKTDNLTCEIIYNHFQTIINHSVWIFYIVKKDGSLYNKQKMHGCLEIPHLFLVLNIFLTCELSCPTLDINLVFPRTHVLFFYLLQQTRSIKFFFLHSTEK